MPENDDNETVADILKRKKGSVRQAALDPGSPSWDDIMDETWAEVKRKSAPRSRLQDVPEAPFGHGVRQMTTQVQPPPPAAATGVFSELLALLRRLEAARIHYTLRHSRHDAVMVEVAVPGERWEIDFLEDGDVDVEVFRSAGGVQAADGLLDQLIQTHRSDAE